MLCCSGDDVDVCCSGVVWVYAVVVMVCMYVVVV